MGAPHKAMKDKSAGVILVNLGTPAEPTTASVRQFLREFLSDPRVVDISPWLWKFLLNVFILPRRAPRVARSYRRIWLADDSPLRLHTRELAEKVGLVFASANPDAQESGFPARVSDTLPLAVTWAMTYGQPSIDQRLADFKQRGIERIVLCPLYPQFSSSTTGPVYDYLAEYAANTRAIPDFRCIHDYHDHPLYIAALASSLYRHWHKHGRKEKLLISFHGLPAAYVKQGDPYINQCKTTARLLADKLNLESDQWFAGFQSRFGKTRWVEPYSDRIISDWAKEGVKSIDVICPSFASDCLETLDEVGVEFRHMFRQAGGQELLLVPCLNSSQDHVELIMTLVKAHL